VYQSGLFLPFLAYNPYVSLHDDDIQAMQFLYGNNKGGGDENAYVPPATTVRTAPDQPPNEFCAPDFRLDTIFVTDDNNTYFFSGRKYWRLLKERTIWRSGQSI
jgi:hypothetical protein